MKLSKKSLVILLVLIAFGLTAALVTTKTSAARRAQDESRRDEDLIKAFRKHQLIKLNPANVAEQVRNTGQVSLVASDRTYDLVLTPNDMRAPNYRAEESLEGGVRRVMERGPVNTYAGYVRGMNNTPVRFTVDENTFEGLILTPEGHYFVESARKYSDAAAIDDYLIYNVADVIKGTTTSCGVSLNEKVETAAREVAPRIQATNLLVIELATDSDLEYTTQAGGAAAANNEILAIMNQVDIVYRLEIGVTFVITFQNAWSTSDGYDNTSQVNLLNSFKAHWQTLQNIQRDITHLYSGKTVIANAGLAFVGQVCNTQTPGNAYGIHGRVVDAPQKFILAAHELGHTLGAPAVHPDGVPGCLNTIMASSSGPASLLTFCADSRAVITTYVNGHTSCMDQIKARPRFDYDGDLKEDLVVFRPGNNFWYLLNSQTGGFSGQAFGTTGDLIAPEDYDGDGRGDIAVFRPSIGSWFLMRSRDGFTGLQFGANGDLPVPGDYDGDGKADVGVYRPSTGAWYILNSNGSGVTGMFFGAAGDIPVPGNDFDGDGKADIAVFRPSNGTWYIQRSRRGFYGEGFGAAGDLPDPADFDGDGRADLAVFRPSVGAWFLNQSTKGFKGVGFGVNGDIPVAADFDGDGDADIALWRPSDGGWYVLRSLDLTFRAVQFGANGDIPIPGAYIP